MKKPIYVYLLICFKIYTYLYIKDLSSSMFSMFRKSSNRKNVTKKNTRRAIYPGKRRRETSTSTSATRKNMIDTTTPLSWRQYESKTPNTSSSSPSPSSPELHDNMDNCHLQDDISNSIKSCPGNQLAKWGLSKYTMDNGRTLNIHSDTFTKKLGDMDCTKLKSKLRTLLPYLTCDVCKKVQKIQLYHHDIKSSQFSIVPLLFTSMPQLREIRLGSNVTGSPTQINTFQTKYGISWTAYDTPSTGKYILFKRDT